jgi:prepilin-type N-terminal cleavage/methylation domain-containing protein
MRSRNSNSVCSFEFQVSNLKSGAHHSAFHAFTLIEMLTVIAIIGILAAMIGPTVTHFRKGDATLSATRQMLDAVAHARQLAISQRTTVYMVFVPTNFWGNDPFNSSQANAWGGLNSTLQNSATVTQLYGAQLTGYFFASLHGLGDQPGQSYPRYLGTLKVLPEAAFIPNFKFTAPPRSVAPFILVTNTATSQGFPIYGFLTTNNIPFPTAEAKTSGTPYVTLPYVAFNYLGQLIDSDGNVRDYDEYIPLAHGSVGYSLNLTNRMPIQASPTSTESPPGNSIEAYNLIHIDALTGRARLEHREVQ